MDIEKYIYWKNWVDKDFGLLSPGYKFYFKQLFNLGPIDAKNFLEIGFGNGELLNYFDSLGISITGIEINEKLVERAKNAGFKVYLGNAYDINELQMMKFDIIAAISVIEHMTFEQLSKLFIWLGNHLSIDGKVYLVFPEGASPFGLANHNGDFTHKTCLTKSKIEALCLLANLKILSYRDEPLFSNKLCSWGLLGRILLRVIQLYINTVRKILLFFFYPLGTGLRLGVNSIAVLSRR